ncbi:MAG: hypothetical protein AAF612_11250, partial [Planctomycetota bacterium]
GPGLVAVGAGMFRLWPGDALAVAAGIAAVSWMQALAGIVAVYRLIRLREGPGLAAGVAFTLAAADLWHQHALEALPDAWFACGAALALWGYERYAQRLEGRRWVTAVLLVAGVVLMISTRSVGLVFVAALGIAEGARAARAKRWKALAVGAGASVVGLVVAHGVLVAPAAPWTLHPDVALAAGKLTTHLPATAGQAWSENLPHLLWEAAPEALFGMDPGHAGPLAGGVAVVLGVALLRLRLLWGVWFCLLLVQWVVFVPTDRYVLPVLPVLVYAYWKACIGANRWVARRIAGWSMHVRRASGVGFVALLGLLYAPNALRVVRTVGVQHAEPFYERYRDGKYVPWLEASGWLQENAADGAAVVTPDEAPYAELAVWSGLRVGSSKWTGEGRRGLLVEAKPLAERGAVSLHGWRRGELLYETEAVDRKGRTVRVRRSWRGDAGANPGAAGP